MNTKTSPAPTPEPRSASEAAESAELRDVTVSFSGYGAKVRLHHGRGELVLGLDWRASAAFLHFAERKLDAADAMRAGFRPRPREMVSWEATPTPEESTWFTTEPRFIRYDLYQNQFAVNFVRSWQEEKWVWLFISEGTLRALAWELRNGLALNRHLNRR